MIKVGVTGGIGSGKTWVSTLFMHLGVPVYSADQRARELMESSQEIKQRLTDLLGVDTYREGHLNTSFLARIIFRDEQLREQVNVIVHPVVLRDFDAWAASFQEKPYVIQEAAIIFESGADRYLDRVINVYAPVKVRIGRIVHRDGITVEDVRARMRSQMSEQERQRRADHTIINDGKRMVTPQVIKVHEELVKLIS